MQLRHFLTYTSREFTGPARRLARHVVESFQRVSVNTENKSSQTGTLVRGVVKTPPARVTSPLSAYGINSLPHDRVPFILELSVRKLPGVATGDLCWKGNYKKERSHDRKAG